ncbi:UTRA domain-containing protein [Longispora urticae]
MSGTPRWSASSLPYLLPRAAGQPDAWTAELAGSGLTGSQQLTEVAEVEAPADVAAALGLPAGGRVVVRRRVMRVGDRAVELTDSYYPVHIAAGTGLAERRKIPGGAVTLLAALGHVPARAREDVTARMPTPAERAALALGEGEPVLVLCRLLSAAGDVPVEVSVMTMPAHGRHLGYETALG